MEDTVKFSIASYQNEGHFRRETANKKKQKKRKQNHGCLIHTFLEKAYKGTVVNQALPTFNLK